MKKYEPIVYSAVGLLALLLVLVAANFLLSKAPARIDLTEGKLYTLSPGTKRILANLPAPVKLKLYASQGEAVPVPLRGFSQRVSDLVNELKREAGDRLVVERLHPRPQSENPDAAQLHAIEPQHPLTGQTLYARGA